jgi:protein involved in polysaccharide export with SLBB domain
MLAIDPDSVAGKELAQLADKVSAKLAEHIESMAKRRPQLEPVSSSAA